MPSLNYEQFSTYTEIEKLALFDQGVPLTCFSTEKCKRIFLRDVVEKSPNDFFRKKSLERLALMIFFGESSNYSTAVSVISDIEENDDDFVISSKIKYLFLLNDKLNLNDSNIINQIDKLRFHTKGEVSSQAYYYVGLSALLDANSSDSELDFFEKIGCAKKYFDGASSVIENRIDAEYLLEVCELILVIPSANKADIDKQVSSINKLIFDRRSSYIHSSVSSLEIWIYKATVSMCEVVLSNPSEWLDIKAELNNICYLHYSLVDIELNGMYSSIQEKIGPSFSDNLLKPFYKKSLKQYIAAIKRLCRESPENKKFVNFSSILISSIEQGGDLKKKIDIDILLNFRKSFPLVPIETIKKDVSECSGGSLSEIIKLFGRYSEEYLAPPILSLTGSRVGDEIFDEIVARITGFIPNYSQKKLSEFKVVLSDVIKYSQIAASQKKSGKDFFKYLFDANASEDDLQQSMFAYFQMNSCVSSKYKLEVDEVADGGRVDILYSSDSVVLPIELKKTDVKPSIDNIADSYLSQAQTYCYPNDQLGLFVLLDNSSKGSKLNNPINDIREFFDVYHMEPYYEFGEKAPNYVVSVIIPGNKVLPSKRSTYK
ncbi:hypothetical protein SAMN05519226_0087 [Cycloclasticus pugetii]|nr:hypothetical protein SAMN05519226_0087 [Cycloclasticus pugetii]